MNEDDRLNIFLRALAHPARLQILGALREGEQCVCHMEAHLGLRQAYISQQLSVLREAGLIEDRRDGWNVYYHVTRPEVFDLIANAARVAGVTTPAVNTPRPNPACPCPKCAEKRERLASTLISPQLAQQ